MKKIVLLGLLISTFANAQKFSYGVILGADFYEVMNNSGSSNFKSRGSTAVNIGGYGEYNFTNKWGIKTELTFNKKEIEASISGTPFDFSFLEVCPSVKYDFGQEYRKGFYMLFGPKVVIMTKAESDGTDVKDAFETTIFGAQYGVGTRVAKYFDIEAKIDYEFTPFYQVDSYKSDFFGFYLNLGVDLERLLSKS